MILPIYVFGHPVLREKNKDIDSSYPNIQELIQNMFETMYEAEGIGLAAPQVGYNIRLFVIDLEPLAESEPKYKGFKKVFINPQIVESRGKNVKYEEGCLSIPGINESVERESEIVIKYIDENFEMHEEVYGDFFARCIQHEYDHVEGVMFVDRITPIRKQMVKKKLQEIAKGKKQTFYKTRHV